MRGICHEVIDGRGMRPAGQYLPHLKIRGNELFHNNSLAGDDTVWYVVHVERYDNLGRGMRDRAVFGSRRSDHRHT